jgi:hypothetical protein
MVDPVNYLNALFSGREKQFQNYDLIIEDNVTYACLPFKICPCDRCGKLIYQHAVRPKFSGYSKFDPETVPELSEHQYFICEARVTVFVFKLRSWGESPPYHGHEMNYLLLSSMPILTFGGRIRRGLPPYREASRRRISRRGV